MQRITNDNIQKELEQLSDFLKKNNFNNKDEYKYVLLVEEILLNYREHCGEDISFKINLKTVFKCPRITIQIYSNSYDFRDIEETNEEIILKRLLLMANNSPSWSYKNNCNYITILAGEGLKIPEIIWVFLAVLLAALTYYMLPFFPSAISSSVSEIVIPQLVDVVSGILKMIAGLLIFFTITNSMVSIGNLETLKIAMSRIFSRIFLNNIFMILAFAGIFKLFCRMGQDSFSLGFENIFDLFIDMIPLDVFSPFINGNMVQITLIAIALSIILIVIGKSANIIIQMVESLQQVTQIAMQGFCRILPLLVYLNVFTVFESLNGFSISKIIIPTVVGIVVILLFCFIETMEVCFLHKINPVQFLKKCLPGTLVGLSTASTAAALETIKEDLMNMNIDLTFINFVVPLEQVFYKPYTIIVIFTGVLGVYRTFDMSLSVGGLINICILAFIISIACPSVPGGMLSCLTILSTQMLLPYGSIGILVLFATLFDYFGGGLSVFSIHSEVIGQAYRLKRLSKSEQEIAD